MDKSDHQLFQRVGAVSTFLRQVEQIEHGNKKNVFYREHSKKDYSPLPSIFRKVDWINNEAKMFNELVMRCPSDFPISTSDIAAKLGLSTNTINTVLKTLRDKGLVDLAGTVKNGIFKSIHWGAFK